MPTTPNLARTVRLLVGRVHCQKVELVKSWRWPRSVDPARPTVDAEVLTVAIVGCLAPDVLRKDGRRAQLPAGLIVFHAGRRIVFPERLSVLQDDRPVIAFVTDNTVAAETAASLLEGFEVAINPCPEGWKKVTTPVLLACPQVSTKEQLGVQERERTPVELGARNPDDQGLTGIEREIEHYVVESVHSAALREMLADEQPYVIKYLPAKHLSAVLSRGELYASERAGFTWGDAIYVAPLSRPLSTMMFGQVGVVGRYPRAGRRFFDACAARGIDLYQEWIRHQTRAYRELTTTVHASAANRELRNGFRSRFAIDCVLFRPDEPCQGYVNAAEDMWLAVTHWDTQHSVGHGFSPAVADLKWCVITPDAFDADGIGYKAYLYQSLTAPHFPAGPRQYLNGHYSSLSADVVSAYLASVEQVVVCDFT